MQTVYFFSSSSPPSFFLLLLLQQTARPGEEEKECCRLCLLLLSCCDDDGGGSLLNMRVVGGWLRQKRCAQTHGTDRTNNLYNGGIPPITQRTKDTPLGKEGIEQSSPPPPLVVIIAVQRTCIHTLAFSDQSYIDSRPPPQNH